MEEVYAQSYRELLKLNLGKKLGKTYLVWYTGHARAIFRDWFGGEYTEEDIIKQLEVLKWFMIGKFYEWMGSDLLGEI